MSLLKLKQRVRIKSINAKGKIFYIDQPNYFNHFMSPIQVELDKAYGDGNQTMYRTDVTDIVKLKKKKKVVKEEDDGFDIIF